MEAPRKVEVQLPPDQRRWGCLHWLGAGCLLTLVLIGIGSYLAYKRYLSPLTGGVRTVLREAEAIWELSEAEVLSQIDTLINSEAIEEDPDAYRGRFLKLHGIVESDEPSTFSIEDRTYLIFQVGEGVFVLASRAAEEVAYGDRVEITGKVSTVDVAGVLDKVAPGIAAGLAIDRAVIFIATRVHILPAERRQAHRNEKQWLLTD